MRAASLSLYLRQVPFSDFPAAVLTITRSPSLWFTHAANAAGVGEGPRSRAVWLALAGEVRMTEMLPAMSAQRMRWLRERRFMRVFYLGCSRSAKGADHATSMQLISMTPNSIARWARMP
uniref:Uncharacterized protein n=1 Tax=Pseudomonas fluorescens (strain SBW25) TaxID=216595 RepID=A4V6Z2_PSEFS|nr:hypothetical protein pQBR0271 [Pseudomonas fluorescens SBW25]